MKKILSNFFFFFGFLIFSVEWIGSGGRANQIAVAVVVVVPIKADFVFPCEWIETAENFRIESSFFLFILLDPSPRDHLFWGTCCGMHMMYSLHGLAKSI